MITGDWLGRREALTPNKTALIDVARPGREPRALTYREWNRSVIRTARWLVERFGVQKGDRVAALAMNSVEMLDLWFACGKLGAIFQPLNWRLTPAELGPLIADGEPVVVVYGPDFIAQISALRRAPLAASFSAVDRAAPRFAAFDEACRADPSDPALAERESFDDAPLPAAPLTPDDPWVLCYTGGSTGVPKGALLTHGNIHWNSVNTVMSWGLTPGDVTILNAPLFHTGGLNVLTAPLVHIGGTSVVCRGFDTDQVFDLLESAGVTVLFGVPTMFLAITSNPRFQSADLSRLRFVISGGAPCPPPLFEAFWARGVEFKTGYGLTEAGPNTFWLPSEYVRKKPGCVGAPLFHVETKIAAADGREAAQDEVGELLLRGPHVFAGYFRRPDETARALEDGWLHTGDLARRDGDGHYWIAGRIKDLIISGGENIYPSEVEAVLTGHPAVAEAAVIGVPDDRYGEVGRAILVLRPGLDAPVNAGDIHSFLRDRLAKYKIPKSVVFVDALPRTGAGKVDKRALASLYGAGRTPSERVNEFIKHS